MASMEETWPSEGKGGSGERITQGYEKKRKNILLNRISEQEGNGVLDQVLGHKRRNSC